MNDNFPPGAANDPMAPYNEPVPKETVKQFELNIKGKVYLFHNTEEELDEKIKDFRTALETLIYSLGVNEDYKVETLFSEVW